MMVQSMVTFLSVEKKRRQHSLDDFCFAFHDFVGFFFLLAFFVSMLQERQKCVGSIWILLSVYKSCCFFFFNIHDGHLGWRDVDDVGR
jgi:hypothetical protein